MVGCDFLLGCLEDYSAVFVFLSVYISDVGTVVLHGFCLTVFGPSSREILTFITCHRCFQCVARCRVVLRELHDPLPETVL